MREALSTTLPAAFRALMISLSASCKQRQRLQSSERSDGGSHRAQGSLPLQPSSLRVSHFFLCTLVLLHFTVPTQRPCLTAELPVQFICQTRPSVFPWPHLDIHASKVCDLCCEAPRIIHRARDALPLGNHAIGQADSVIVLTCRAPEAGQEEAGRVTVRRAWYGQVGSNRGGVQGEKNIPGQQLKLQQPLLRQ
jgi:hypothetical protein